MKISKVILITKVNAHVVNNLFVIIAIVIGKMIYMEMEVVVYLEKLIT